VCDVGFPEFFAQVIEAGRRKSLFIYQRFEVDNLIAILDPCDPKFLRRLPDEDVDRIFGKNWIFVDRCRSSAGFENILRISGRPKQQLGNILKVTIN
jgi:hypothetical protein